VLAGPCIGADMRVYTHVMARECYCAVLRTAARKVTAIYDAALEPSGINLAQYSLLRTIQRRAPLSLTELGRLTELDRSTIGRNVRLLQRLGLVRVEPGAEDQREAVVTLDQAGADALQLAGPLWDEAQRRVESALGTDPARQLRTLLQTL
jgi:DNA-binding MarR family transcriptional regulator